jgi:ABC-type transporter Mla MlaB component
VNVKAEFITKKRKSGTCLITVKGDLTAQYSAEFKQCLQQCLVQGGTFEISLKHINAIDVTALQLIQSFKNDFPDHGSIIQLHPPEDKNIYELLVRSGLIQIVGNKNT